MAESKIVYVPRGDTEFKWKRCKECRLDCVERDAANKDGLELSLDTKKFRGRCRPKEKWEK